MASESSPEDSEPQWPSRGAASLGRGAGPIRTPAQISPQLPGTVDVNSAQRRKARRESSLNVSRYNCPIEACVWFLDHDNFGASPASLERQLIDHASDHDIRDWASEVQRLRSDSIKLNGLSWLIAKAVGDVPEGVTEIQGDVDEQLARLIKASIPTSVSMEDGRERGLAEGQDYVAQ